MQLTAPLNPQVWTISYCDVVLVLVVDIGVLIGILNTRVVFGRSGEGAAVKAELKEGLQGWEAGAGDAD